ncbi:hypothetical protein BDW22DRAFT_1482166 [Trametopsis cervina]|nr:hypothetical protein BDW22DRAFT_1482166 [Trametopsis cervina]
MHASQEEDGQAPPMLNMTEDEDVVTGFPSFSEAEDLLSQIEQNTRDRKLKKEFTLSEFMRHLTSLPNASDITGPSLPGAPRDPPLVLYDQHGITRRMRLNGVEVLRTIPPFGILTEGYEPVECPIPGSGAEASASNESAMECLEAGSTDENSQNTDDESDDEQDSWRSTTPTAPARHNTPIEIDDDSTDDSSDADTVRLETPPREVSMDTEEVHSVISSEKSAHDNQPSPLRATLSIEWPANESSMSDVIYAVSSSWPLDVVPVPPPMEKQRTPSPLPSLTPSPPPVVTIETPGKREATEGLQGQSKRVRRSCAVAAEGVAGPSRIVLSPVSPENSDAESEYESPSPRRAPRSRAPRSPSKPSNARQFWCLVKGCERSQSFSAPKDRNRHMDTHFQPRFECPTCNHIFPRDDALKRHCKNASSGNPCSGAYVNGADYSTHAPYWKTCSLDLLERPPDSDPLILLWNRKD